MALDEHDRRRVCKVLLAWSDKDRDQLGEEAGFKPHRIRTALDEGKKSPPTTDELFALAAVAGVPEHFVVDGWAKPLHDRLAILEAATEALSASVDEATSVLVRHGREIAELRADRPPGESREGNQ